MIVQPVPTMGFRVNYFKTYQKAAERDLLVYIHFFGNRFEMPTGYVWNTFYADGSSAQEGLHINIKTDALTPEELCEKIARLHGYTY